MQCGNLRCLGDIHVDAWKSYPPFLDENSANEQGKPTMVTRGITTAYSMPEYAVGEELLFKMRSPGEWDGTTDPLFMMCVYLSAAEDVGDKFKFELEVQSTDIYALVSATVDETVGAETTIGAGQNAQYFTFPVLFELDATLIHRYEQVQMRLRRVAPASPSVSNEIAVCHWDTQWKRSRIGTPTAYA